MLRKKTDIIYLAGGVRKVFTLVEGGFKKFWQLAKGGSKKFDDKNFKLPSPPHQSIYEHSLRVCFESPFTRMISILKYMCLHPPVKFSLFCLHLDIRRHFKHLSIHFFTKFSKINIHHYLFPTFCMLNLPHFKKINLPRTDPFLDFSHTRSKKKNFYQDF